MKKSNGKKNSQVQTECLTRFYSDYVRDLNFIAQNHRKAGLPRFRSISFTIRTDLPHYGNFFGEEDISILKLSNRSENALRNNKINTINELIASWGVMLALRGLGVTGIAEIKNKLISEYYNLLSISQREKFWLDALSSIR